MVFLCVDSKHAQQRVDYKVHIVPEVLLGLVEQRKLECLPHGQGRHVLVVFTVVDHLTAIALCNFLGRDAAVGNLALDGGIPAPIVGNDAEKVLQPLPGRPSTSIISPCRTTPVKSLRRVRSPPC